MRNGFFLLNAIFQLINLLFVSILSFGEPIYARGGNEIHIVVAAFWQILFIDFFFFLIAISGIINTYRQDREVRFFYILFIPAIITAYIPQIAAFEQREDIYAIILQYKPIVIATGYAITYLLLLAGIFKKSISIKSTEIE